MRNRGVSLIELLISLLLTSFLVTALMNCYLQNSTQFEKNSSAINEAIELGLLTDFIRDVSHHAGFTPCQTIDNLVRYNRRFPHKKIQAVHVENNASRLIIMRMSETFTSVKKIASPYRFTLSDIPPVNLDRQWMIADCFHAETLQIDSTQIFSKKLRIELKAPLLYSYENAYFGEWIEEEFNVHKNKETQSLYYKMNKSEQLSSLIDAFNVAILTGKRFPLISALFHTRSGKSVTVLTSMRN